MDIIRQIVCFLDAMSAECIRTTVIADCGRDFPFISNGNLLHVTFI